MLEFRDIDISDRERINKALRSSDFMGCEYSFANNLAWRRLSDLKISFYKNFYICCTFGSDDGIPGFIFPAGEGDHSEVIAEMKRFSDSLGKPLKIMGVTERTLPLLDELYHGQFSYQADRGDCDYIYNSSDLIGLAGKKYHGKRNHFTRFSRLDYSFSPITEKDYDDCITFAALTYNSRADGGHSYVAEQFAINTFFNYYEKLELKGAIIRIGGETAAFTIGEGLNSETFCVHIEKADTKYEGIYAGINKLFAEEAAAGHKYINREEDMGLEGLRKSKLSYHPAFLLKKYTVIFNI